MIRFKNLDPAGERREAELRTKRSKQPWEQLRQARREFSRRLLGQKCWSCTSRSELQIDHWDNDRSNNSPENARTLCGPCHEQKTLFAKADRDPDNVRFTEWVETQQTQLGTEEFGKRQQDSRLHHVYETVCSKPRYSHRYTYCHEKLAELGGFCPFCPEFSSRLKTVGERIERVKCRSPYGAVR